MNQPRHLRLSRLAALAALIGSALLVPTAANAATPSTAPTVHATRTAAGYHLTWTGVAGATGYHVYYEKLTSMQNNGGGGETFGAPQKHLSKTVAANVLAADFGDSMFSLETQSWYGENFYVAAYNGSGDGPQGRGYASCAPGYYLSARGSSDNPNSSGDNGFAYGLGDRSFRVYEDARRRLSLSRNQFQAEAVLYPAAPVISGSVATFGANYDSSENNGNALLQSMITRITSHCSTSRIYVFGFSQGADVAGDAFAAISTADKARIQHVTLLADADRYRGDLAIQYRANNASSHGIHGTRPAFQGVTDRLQVVSWCAEDDDVCSVDSSPFTFHPGATYDCYEKWEAEAIAARAQAKGWIAHADVTHPTCTLTS